MNFLKDHRKIRVWRCLLALRDWHKAQRYQQMGPAEGRWPMGAPCPAPKPWGNKEPARWLSERIALAILQGRDRPTGPLSYHVVLFNLPQVIHVQGQTQTHALTSNTRLTIKNLDTVRAAIRAMGRNTAWYLKSWYQGANTGWRSSQLFNLSSLPSHYYGSHQVHPPGPQTVGVNYHFFDYKVRARSKFLIPHLLYALAWMYINISKYMTKAFGAGPCINKCYFVLMTAMMTESYRVVNAGHLVYFTWNGILLDMTFPKLLS